jgi:hypothetical protein
MNGQDKKFLAAQIGLSGDASDLHSGDLWF